MPYFDIITYPTHCECGFEVEPQEDYARGVIRSILVLHYCGETLKDFFARMDARRAEMNKPSELWRATEPRSFHPDDAFNKVDADEAHRLGLITDELHDLAKATEGEHTTVILDPETPKDKVKAVSDKLREAETALHALDDENPDTDHLIGYVGSDIHTALMYLETILDRTPDE